MKKERNTSLDIIRIIALFSVTSIHFFWHNGFYGEIVNGEKMWLMFLVRTASTVCVPLFLVLSGYLMRNKKLSRQYYKGLQKTLLTYVLVSLVCIVFKWLYYGEEISFKYTIFCILNFGGANYSWYVEMYLGLFLLIPFLNIIYANLDTHRKKRQLLVSLLFLTSIPGIVNVFNFDMGLQWWVTPIIANNYAQILPDWWTGIYPITYYFIGCYLSEFYESKKLKKLGLILSFLVSVLVFGTYNYWRSYGGVYTSGPWDDWGAMPNVIMTVLVFVLILNIDTSRWALKIKKLLGKISDLCFGAYLLSFIFDSIFYAVLNKKIVDVPERLPYYPLIVTMVFLCSLILSYFINLVCTGILFATSFVGNSMVHEK